MEGDWLFRYGDELISRINIKSAARNMNQQGEPGILSLSGATLCIPYTITVF